MATVVFPIARIGKGTGRPRAMADRDSADRHRTADEDHLGRTIALAQVFPAGDDFQGGTIVPKTGLALSNATVADLREMNDLNLIGVEHSTVAIQIELPIAILTDQKQNVGPISIVAQNGAAIAGLLDKLRTPPQTMEGVERMKAERPSLY